MGYNCTVVVLHDALGQIENDPEFGRKLSKAIINSQSGPDNDHLTRWVSSGNHGNAAYVVESHHADHQVLVMVGGNIGYVVRDAALHRGQKDAARPLPTDPTMPEEPNDDMWRRFVAATEDKTLPNTGLAALWRDIRGALFYSPVEQKR